MLGAFLLVVGLLASAKVCEGFLPIEYLIGGWTTNVGQYPHMAVLGRLKSNNESVEWFCGGTLISKQFVLTAAHCANSRMLDPPTVVRLGEYDLSTDDDSEHQDMEISEIVHHPAYNGIQAYNDVSLIRLNKSVAFGRFIKPACLWQLDTIPSERLIAIGWGQLGHYGDQPSELHQVDLPVIATEECNRMMSFKWSRRLNMGVLPSQICAGEIEGGKDTCEGDSGGPLQFRSQNPTCGFEIVGITSIGSVCGTAQRPGVYTRISYFMHWIESIVWEKQQ